MKKCILIALLTCLVMVLSAVPVFAEAVSSTSAFNATALQQIVAEKLGAGDYTYELLAGFAEANRYTLVEGDSCYLIYDNLLQDFVEYSTDGNSDYYDLDSDARKMYFGPTYYFYQQDNHVIDMSNGQQLDESAVVAFAHSEQEKVVSQFSVQSDSQQSATTYEVQLEDLTDEQKRVLYFSNLTWKMGVNDSNTFSGSCSIVAIGMMLSYFDSFRDDTIIPEEFDVPTDKLVKEFLSEINLEEYPSSPGTDTKFQQYLISRATELKYYDNDTTSYGLDHEQVLTLFNYYLSIENISALAKKQRWRSAEDCRELMSNYGPVMLGIELGESFGESSGVNHAVVAYEYISKNDIRANYGWRNHHINTNVLKDKIYYAYYVPFDDDYHSCSNNYQWLCGYDWVNHGCSGTLCPCGKITCYHEAGTNCVSAGSTKHNNICTTCGEVTSSASHKFVPSGINQKCTECSYVKLHTHQFTYTPAGRNMHTAMCTTIKCKYQKTEGCMGFANIYGETKCGKCGQTMSGGIIVTSEDDGQEQIAETLRSLAVELQPQIILP